mmetsp:Transcript_72604/g.166517  ORF Transcript_72604/g.166517 Transcript_72604/m.166517 type:complete len:965 (+) Transcript_72604:536-3430(+)
MLEEDRHQRLAVCFTACRRGLNGMETTVAQVHNGTESLHPAFSIPVWTQNSGTGGSVTLESTIDRVERGADTLVVLSRDHVLEPGDRIVITGVAGFDEVNNMEFEVSSPNASSRSFSLSINGTSIDSGYGLATGGIVRRTETIAEVEPGDETIVRVSGRTTAAAGDRAEFDGVAGMLTVDHVSEDSRPLCQASNFVEVKGQRVSDSLLCVTTDAAAEPFEKVDWPASTCLSTDGWCFSWLHVMVCVLVVDVVQAGCELLVLVAGARSDDVAEFDQATTKCYAQTAVTVYIFAVCVLVVKPFTIAQEMGSESNVWATFFMVVIFGQLKSLALQPIIWFVIVRRCGRLDPTCLVQVYNEEFLQEAVTWGEQMSLMEQTRRRVRVFLLQRTVHVTIIGLVCFYSVFILINIGSDEYISQLTADGVAWPADLFTYLDTTVLCIFLVEIIVKSFAYGPSFFDIWTTVDAIVVAVSVVLALSSVDVKGLGLLRLLRLLRVVIIVRKVSAGRKKLRNLKKNSSGPDVSSHVDRVLETIDNLQSHKALPQHIKDDLEWVTTVITSNKLYTVSVEDDAHSGDAATAWIASGVEHPGQSQINLDDVTSRVPAAGKDGIAENRGPDFENEDDTQWGTHLAMLSGLSQAEADHLETALKPLEDWNFDIHIVAETTADHISQSIFMKLVIHYDLVRFLKLDFDKMFAFSSAIQKSYRPASQVLFHGGLHAADMLQCIHYCLQKPHQDSRGLGFFMDNLDKLVAFCAPLVINYAHPGVSNAFLCRTRHPRAIRYNDRFVLQNYNLAACFEVANQPESAFLSHADREFNEAWRMMLIAIVLRSDISSHYEELGLLQTKIAAPDFPDPTQLEHRLMLLSATVRLAEVSWGCRPQPTFKRWANLMVEQLFMQGDLEKQIGVPVSPFCDREIVSKPRCQVSFLLVVVNPFVAAFCAQFDNVKKELVDEGCEANQAVLQTAIR